MNQGQEFELCGKRNMPSGSALEYVMKRGGGGGNSSNCQEFCNLVETLGDLVRKKELYGRKVFLCTNNIVSESISAEG